MSEAESTIPEAAPSRPAHYLDGKHRLTLDHGELSQLDPYDRQQVLTIVRRVNLLNEQIHRWATEGKPFAFARIERKALRWALEQLGLTLPPNEPIPERRAPAMATVATDPVTPGAAQ